MTVVELLELFRKEVDDETKLYLWSDKEFFVYLNEAQDTFVRLIGGIADRRSALTNISYKIGNQFKKFDDRIYRIKGAFDENNKILSIRNLDHFAVNGASDDYGVRNSSGLDNSRTGPIKYLITDVESNEIQLYPIPDSDGSIRLYVYRRPLSEIVDENSELEIPSYQHVSLLDWVKYRAFMKQDVETFDGTKAASFRTSFTDFVGQAKKEKSAREDTKREMAYGGIPM
jgi:hypothetical protein